MHYAASGKSPQASPNRGLSRMTVFHILFLAACLPASLCHAGSLRAAASPSGAAWITEWDLASGWEERQAMGDAISSTQMFGAYFDASDRPFMAGRLSTWLAEAKIRPADAGRLYLTVVNDVIREKGQPTAKDPDLVSRLLASAASREKHRRELMELVRSGPFAGLEIDYEKIKTADWPIFLEFCRELHRDLAEAGLRLRVIVEPRKVYLAKPLPAGPEFVLMAYNLFGTHTGPGPKADPSFIARLASYCRAARIQPFPRLALATGGFSWNGEGLPVTSVTEKTALNLAREAGVTLKRHPYSYYLTFVYTDADEKKHEVWFADNRTLTHLMNAARSSGFELLDVWRLGGNSPETLEAFRKFFRPEGSGIGKDDGLAMREP